ncbi:30S ribosomal protein S19e [Candidatus Woesearchaeota archaeon]|nr:30S ribosomal protein S19e [Candidatus Woesearchaeota archaeon]
MTTINDVDINELIENAAVELKKIIKQPEWSMFVKTGTSKTRPPERDDWWFTRSAAVLRKIYTQGPLGVSKLRTKFGSKKHRGYKPEEFRKASGKIIRVILQELEKAELIKKAEKSTYKGRVVTPKGKSFLDKIASRLAKKEAS